MTELALVEPLPLLQVADVAEGTWSQAPDHLEPVMRLDPNHGKDVFVIGLDPREAGFVFGRGYALLDGLRYVPSLVGWDGRIERDGRVSVRFEKMQS